MENSSRFMALSGWSVFAAGIIALVGTVVARFFILANGAVRYDEYMRGVGASIGMPIRIKMILLAGIVLACAIAIAYFFIARKAKQAGERVWTLSARRALTQFGIPFITGGVFCLALLLHGHIQFLASAMLLFYGLGLVGAAKFTIREIYYLGLCEIAFGLLDAFFFGHSLLFWVLGFGIANVAAGLVIYFKYDRA